MNIEQIVESVQSFNNLAGNPVGCGLEGGNNASSMYDSLITEEVEETKTALEELLDGCADIVVVALGKMHVTDSINLNQLKQETLDFPFTPAEMFSFLLGVSNHSSSNHKADPTTTVKAAIALCDSLGVNPYDVLEEVCAANMSKFCTTQQQAENSVHQYRNDPRYVDVHYVYNEQERLYVILGSKADDSDPNKVLKGIKILKGINTFKPNLSKFLL